MFVISIFRFINSTNVTFTHEKILYGAFEEALFTTRAINKNYKVFLLTPRDVIDILAKNLDTDELTFQTIKYTSSSTISSKQFLNLNRLQRKCRKFDEAEDLRHSPVYTQTLCMIECRMRLCMKYCGCLPYYYRVKSNEKICNLTGLYCLSKHSSDIITLIDANENILCDCMVSCDYTVYDVVYYNTITWFLDTNLEIQSTDFPIIRYKRNVIFTRMDVVCTYIFQVNIAN